MQVSQRELRLLFATFLVLVLGGTYVLAKKQLVQLEELRREQVMLSLQQNRGELELLKKGELVRNLETIKEQLPRHARGRDVTTELSTQVQEMAAQSGLNLTGFQPEREEYLEELDVYEMSIRCKWEGAPQSLISFLYQLQSLGPVMDVQDLKLKTSKNRPGEWLTGSFIVDCAYNRFEPEPEVPAFTTQPISTATETNRSETVPAAPGESS